jgi:LPS-assembly lipoprotein
MSSFDRRSLLILPLALAACGFQPAYGPGGPARDLTGRISAATPADKNGFDLVERLEERLGRPQAPRYDLAYAIRTVPVGVGITPDNAITRYNLTGEIDWTLTDRESGARVAGGTVSGFTSWSATGSTVAGLSAEEDAAYRLMRQLGDQIVAHILAASARFAQ